VRIFDLRNRLHEESDPSEVDNAKARQPFLVQERIASRQDGAGDIRICHGFTKSRRLIAASLARRAVSV